MIFDLLEGVLVKVTVSRLARVFFVSALSINSAFALPIDWTGVFGVDTHMLSNYRRTNDDVVKDPANKTGTEGIASGKNGANFQTYIFRLQPQIIVNDGVTLKGELSSGQIRGGFAGGEAGNNADGSSNNAYFFTSPAQNSALNVNQMYMEMYADTALIKLGRFSRNYGLGMIFDNGTDAWDRFFTMYDGIEAEMKIGNFSLIPHYAKISSTNNLSNGPGSPASGQYDVREMGLIAKYDNKNRDIVASILYAKRSSERRNSFYNASTTGTNVGAGTTASGDIERGKTQITIIEPYVSKKWNKLKVSAEGSLQSGDYGSVYAVGEKSKLSATSYIVDARYDLNPKWDVGALYGNISGDKGNTSKFEATYIHPNFQIADLMFRYHYPSFNEGRKSIFDSSITNTNFYKLFGNYKSDKWTWKGALIMAKANQTAKPGLSYHHEENYRFNSTQKQSNDMGYEVDFGFDYRWNPNVTIGGYYGYWFVGQYYAFTNSAAGELSISNVHGGGMRATLEF